MEATVRESAPAMYAARRARLCLPEPPTPTSSADPRSRASRREMRMRCSSASWKAHQAQITACSGAYHGALAGHAS